MPFLRLFAFSFLTRQPNTSFLRLFTFLRTVFFRSGDLFVHGQEIIDSGLETTPAWSGEKLCVVSGVSR